MDLKIETGIPIPPRGKPSIYLPALRKMNVGDSFKAPIGSHNLLSRVAVTANCRISVRKLNKNEMRVWKVKDGR